MIIRAIVVSLAAFSLVACSTAAPEPPGPGDEAPPAAVERFTAPTEAMLIAALSNDPVAMERAAAATQTGCPAPSTCPTGFGSCTNWSAPSQCAQTCFQSSLCTCPIVIEHPDDPPSDPCVPDLSIMRGRNTFSSFRICFNAQQQACTEFRQSVNFFCGC